MIMFITAALVISTAVVASAASAHAAGGNGASFCSNASAPDGHLIVGDLATYNNPGELVSALAPERGDRGWGWGVQGVCNPNLFP